MTKEEKQHFLDYISAQRELLDIFEQELVFMEERDKEKNLYTIIPMEHKIQLFFDNLTDAKSTLDYVKSSIVNYGIVNKTNLLNKAFGITDVIDKTDICITSAEKAKIELIKGEFVLSLDYEEENK